MTTTFPDMPHLSTLLYLYQGELVNVQSFINENTSMITYGELYGLKAHSGSPVIHFTSLEKISQTDITFPPGIHPPEVIKGYHLDFVGQWFSFENMSNWSIKDFLRVKLADLERQTTFLMIIERQTTTDYQMFLSTLSTFCLLKSSEGRKVVCKVDFKIIEQNSPFRNESTDDPYLRENFEYSTSKANDAAYFESHGVVKSSEKYNYVGEMSTSKDVSKTGRNTCNVLEEDKVGMPTKLKEKVNHSGNLSEKASAEFGVHENGQPDSTEPEKVTNVKKTGEKNEEEKVIETNSEPGARENGQTDLTEPQKERDSVKTGEKNEEEKVIETNSEAGARENGQTDLTEPQKETDSEKTGEKNEEEKVIETNSEPGARENGQTDLTEPEKETDSVKIGEKNEEEKVIETNSEPGARENGQTDLIEPQKETDSEKTGEKVEEEKVIETNSEPGACENGQTDLTEPEKETDSEKTGEKIEEEKVIETNQSEPGARENGQTDSTEPEKETDVESENEPNDTKSENDETAGRSDGSAISSSSQSEVTSESPAESSSGGEDEEDSLSKANNNPGRNSQSEVEENAASDNDSTDDEYDKDEEDMAEIDEKSRKNRMTNMISKKIMEKLPCGVNCVGRLVKRLVIEMKIHGAEWKIECKKRGQDEFRQTTVTVESKSSEGFWQRSKACVDSVDEITEFVVEGILEMNKEMEHSQ